MDGDQMEKRKREVEAIAKKLVKYVETHPNIYDWTQMKLKDLNYKKVAGLGRYWECVREAKEYCNTIFQARLVDLGLERSKMSDSFIRFMLARRHGWTPKEEIEMKVDGNITFRDLISGGEEKEDVDDGCDEDCNEEETE